MDLFDFSCYPSSRKRLEVVNILKKKKLPVVVYGSGRFAIETALFLKENSIVIKCFADKSMYWYEGKNIILGGDKCACIEDINLNSFVDGPYVVVWGFIDASNFDAEKDLFAGCHYFVYVDGYKKHWMSNEFISNNKEMLLKLYCALQDDQSKDVLKAYLYARNTGDVWPLGKLRKHNSYDWDLLAVNAGDVFLDGGAYIGDTIGEISDFGGKFLAFEPDSHNLVKLLKSFSPTMLKCINVFPYALSDRDEVLRFNAAGTMASAIDANGDIEINAIALDKHRCFEDVTVVKLDIEGSELRALQGMENLIRRNHPKLAVCIYHKNEDIVEIFDFLVQFGYRFFMRQHAFSAEETVLYAI